MRASLLLFLAACAPSRPAVEPHPVLYDLDTIQRRLEIHSAYYAGRESWLDVGVHPLPRAHR